jgi:hypothetical protein
MSRSAVTDAKGEFAMKPLPPGKYDVQPAEYPSDRIDPKDPKDLESRPLQAAFVATKVTLAEGMEPEPVEVRASPHVIIEAQFCDGKGQPRPSPPVTVYGTIDNKFGPIGYARPNADGKLVVYVPHGAENVQLNLFTVSSDDDVLRWRRTKDGPLNNSRRPNLGTVTDDVKGIEVLQYAVPILLVKVSTKDGQKLKDPAVTAMYGPGKGMFRSGTFATNGRPSDVRFVHQEDGRFRSAQLFPDEETTVTAHADGYASKSVSVKLAEGEKKEIEIVLEKAPATKDDTTDGTK